MKELLEKILGQIKKTPEGVRAYEDLYHICLETQKTDIPLSVEYLKKLSDIIENRIPQSETDKELRSLFMLHKKVLLAAAPFDFESYLLYVEWEREPDKKFYVPRREVMHPIVQAMQDLIDDRLDLLTISMPPGTGKSTLGIFFLSWVMGRFPDSQSLASAHSGMLTRSFYDGVYQIITDSEYLWADVFPGVKLAATNSKEETIDLHKKHRFSTLTCRAINASLTGATRCDKILYADDLCSGIEEAMSKERLDKLWSAYTNDLKSRKKEGAKEIHIATRWSVHDVIGRLENQYGGDSRAKFIVLPALDADGESNFNYTYGVGFSRHYFEDMGNNLDEASFKALFMNQPIEREGLLYDVDELRRYFELPAEDPDAIIGICDTKDKGSDYAFLPAAYVYGNDYYIDDCVCDNSLPNIVDARLVDILLRCKVKMCRFESNSAGGRVAEKVQNEVKKRGGITRITTKFTIRHDVLLKLFEQYVDDEHALWLLRKTVERSRVDVSYMSDEEYEHCLDKLFDSPLYQYMNPKLFTGEKFMEKHLNIGDQVAQTAGISYRIRIDNYVKIVRGVKFYAGYMDDSYAIHESKEFLQELLEDIIEIANELGITVNTRKTRICKLSEHWRFLQVQYSLTDTGRVIQKINPKRLTAMRRKMKKLAPKLTEKEFTDFYKSWFKNHYKIMSKKQRSNMDTLFNQLKEVTKCTLSPLPMAKS